MKRVLCFLAMSAALCPSIFAQSSSPALDPGLGLSAIRLYEGEAPGGTGNDVPTLTVVLPQPRRENGSAIIVAPGGSYRGVVTNLEGRQVADWFATRGFTAFILNYRLGDKNIYPVPLNDGRRAVRLVRSLEARYGLQDSRIGIVGFSAGGHLAATVATLAGDAHPDARDPVDRLSDRPDFVVLGYPWLNAMQPSVAGEITYCSVTHGLSVAQCAEFDQRYSPARHVSAKTPPVFIYATTDDRTVPVRASVEFYSAMVAAGASVEMHLFRHGAHGSGLGGGDAALDQWAVLLEQWLRGQGLMDKPVPVVTLPSNSLQPKP